MRRLRALRVAQTSALGEEVTLPFVEYLASDGNAPVYVDEESAAAAIPWLQNTGRRLGVCYTSMTTPETLIITYRPDVDRRAYAEDQAAGLHPCGAIRAMRSALRHVPT